MRLSASAFLLGTALLALGACATFEEAYGRPDPTRWTYFEGSADQVVQAIQQALSGGTLRVEGARAESDGTVLTIANWEGSADTTEILVQNTDIEDFGSRAQLYPRRRPLPRWLEIEISGRM